LIKLVKKGEIKKLYTIEQLHNLTNKPKINEISLQLLLQYCACYLEPFEFQYILNDEQSTTIKLRFPQVNFAHLLGVETVAKKSGMKEKDRKRFRGQGAYDDISTGELTFELLKNLNKTIFKSIKDKLIFFYQVPHLAMSAQIIFNFTKVDDSNIECELLIYNTMHGICVHLGLEKEDSGQFYIPRTFLIERNMGTKFIDAQKEEDKNEIIYINKILISDGTTIETTFTHECI